VAQVPNPDAIATSTLEEAPDYHWEGPFEVSVGGDANDNFRIKAMIGFHGELLEGSGFLHLEDEDEGGEVTLTGTRIGGGVSFEIWFTDANDARTPFVCVGALSADEQAMDGSWTFACFDPENCGCDGGAGNFRLTRVRD
jgi:hypothetical protein